MKIFSRLKKEDKKKLDSLYKKLKKYDKKSVGFPLNRLFDLVNYISF